MAKDYEFITCAICSKEPASTTLEQVIHTDHQYMVVSSSVCAGCADGENPAKTEAMRQIWERALTDG